MIIRETVSGRVSFLKDRYMFGMEILERGKFNKAVTRINLRNAKDLMKLLFKSSI